MEKKLMGLLLVITVLSLAVVSCIASPITVQIRSHSEKVELEDADSVNVDIKMGAGKLEVNGGADSLMEGVFSYSNRAYAPEVSYRVRSNGIGSLQILQEDKPGIQIPSSYKNDWDLAFNNDIPMEMDITLGAGESILNFENLSLENFTMQMGAGASFVDLSGDIKDDLTIDIQGGVGELTLILPPDTNIEADVSGGLGEINTSGLYRENDHFISKYSGSGPVLYITIEAGVGQLNLLVQ
ncbi:MAG: toast rack family protein [Anaerolineales bacterium]|nr:toast rack family protein [Anaerolineales bacterium]